MTNALDRFSRAAQALPYGVASVNERNEIIWANRTIQKMLGIKIPQDLNQPITFIFRNNAFIKLIENTDNDEKKEILIKSKNLKINIIDFGKYQKIILCQDQTSEIEIEKNRKIFISDISHELKTPLTIIQGYAELLNEDKNLTNKSAAKLILEQSKHMASIINDLLTLSSLENKSKSLKFESVSFKKLFSKLEQDSKILLKNKNITLNFQASSKEIRADASDMYTLLMNLLTNAIRYTDKGIVNIKWIVKSKITPQLIVSDTGIGIPKSSLNKILDRFYRVDPSRSRLTGGTGLGLSIVKEIVDSHDCKLLVSSKENVGTEFIIEFPKDYLI